MSNQKIVEKMINVVETIEKENHRDRYDSEKRYKSDVVNKIISELDKVIGDENK